MESAFFGFFFIILITSLSTVTCNCNSNSIITGGSGTIQSPNYPNEYGKPASCSWTFDGLTNSKYYLNLTAKNVKLYLSMESENVCSGSYNLSINGDQVACNRRVDTSTSPISFCQIYYSTSSCKNFAEPNSCKTSQQVAFPIAVAYVSDGKMSSSLSEEQLGFQLDYHYIPCPGNDASVSYAGLLALVSIPLQLSVVIFAATGIYAYMNRDKFKKKPARSPRGGKNSNALQEAPEGIYDNDGTENTIQNRAYEEIEDKRTYESIGGENPYENTKTDGGEDRGYEVPLPAT